MFPLPFVFARIQRLRNAIYYIILPGAKRFCIMGPKFFQLQVSFWLSGNGINKHSGYR